MDYFKKKELINRIKNTKEPIAIDIFKMIQRENPKVNYSKSFNSIYIKLDEFTDELLLRIEKFIESAEKVQTKDWNTIETQRNQEIEKLKGTLVEKKIQSKPAKQIHSMTTITTNSSVVLYKTAMKFIQRPVKPSKDINIQLKKVKKNNLSFLKKKSLKPVSVKEKNDLKDFKNEQIKPSLNFENDNDSDNEDTIEDDFEELEELDGTDESDSESDDIEGDFDESDSELGSYLEDLESETEDPESDKEDPESETETDVVVSKAKLKQLIDKKKKTSRNENRFLPVNVNYSGQKLILKS